ncbi:MAG: hypothetical protein U0350_03925 [Caldilineaceae bacterium]
MSTYSLPDLLQKWQLGELTAEQMIGYLLQHLLALVESRAELEKRLRRLEQLMQPKL